MPHTINATFRFTVACVCLVVALYASAKSSRDDAPGPVSRPLEQLSQAELNRFEQGKAEFAARWVPPFVSNGHWGRGPHSNAASCIDCHPRNGRGTVPATRTDPPHSVVLRLSLPGIGAHGGVNAHAVYGTHLNRHGITGTLLEEGDFRIAWLTYTVELPDGERVKLRRPVIRITSLWYGPLEKQTVRSLRLAQPVYGLGLLEAVSAKTLQALASAQRERGVNGRLNQVYEHSTGTVAIGRFGHKASHPTLMQQAAAAFLDEMGVTTNLFPDDSCPPLQTQCDYIERLSTVEASDQQLTVIVDYLRMLAPPPRRDVQDASIFLGEALFGNAGCGACHVPYLTTGSDSPISALHNQVIHPYTDLLLHDMGHGLADGQTEFSAGGRDWRTAPLWGLGLRKQINGHTHMLHDGRARTVTEAILWHGGEAEESRHAFMQMQRQDRAALLKFLDSL